MNGIARAIAISISWMVLSLALAFGTPMTALMISLTWGVYFFIKLARLPADCFYSPYEELCFD